MPSTEFSPSLKAVLVHEGGFSNHPRDPGGATMKGVTQRVYDAFRLNHNVEKQSVAKITTTELEMIYRAQYWDAIKGDQLPAGVAYAVFDGAVNSGPMQAAKWLQRALGITADGHIGAATVAAANAHPDHDRLIAQMLALRLAFLKALKTWSDFGKGWGARVRDVQTRGQAWASGSVGPVPVGIPGAAEKARVEDAKPAPSPAAADATAGTGLGTGGALATINETKASLEPLAGSSELIGKAVAVLALLAVALTLGGLALGQWQRYRARKHAEALA